jgi:hypothetical protein
MLRRHQAKRPIPLTTPQILPPLFYCSCSRSCFFIAMCACPVHGGPHLRGPSAPAGLVQRVCRIPSLKRYVAAVGPTTRHPDSGDERYPPFRIPSTRWPAFGDLLARHPKPPSSGTSFACSGQASRLLAGVPLADFIISATSVTEGRQEPA